MGENRNDPDLEKEQNSSENEVTETEKKEEKRGLFGGKKRERNDKAMLFIYVLAAVYLLMTAYNIIRDLVDGKIEGYMRIVSGLSGVIFALVAVWVLFSCWKTYKKMKQKEEEEARKLAEENGETYEKPEKTGLFGMGMTQGAAPQQSSVASRAAVYCNPADDEDDEEEDGTDEDRTDEEADPEQTDEREDGADQKNPDEEAEK